METFGKEFFKYCAKFDFDRQHELKSVFQTSKDPERLIKELTLYCDQPIIAVPETRLTVLGFGRDKKGEFKIIIEQPFIDGQPVETPVIPDHTSANILWFGLCLVARGL